jgi:hypothetical protein
MTKVALALLLVLPSFAVAQKTPVSVAGKWKVTSTMAGNESSSDCTFTQTGADLAGSCTGDQGTVKISGKVDGTTVSWSYSSDYNGTPLTVKYKGKYADGKISGESTVDPFDVSGEFTATATK